jgi:Tfp pilus assembly protein PilN
MSISVFISNNDIQILSGQPSKDSVKVQDIYHITPENGVMVNGVLVNEEELKAIIESTWEKYDLSRKDVRLIVESTQFRSRKVVVPKKMAEKERLRLIMHEFEIPEEEEDSYLCDYMSLGEEDGGGEVVLGMTVESEIVQGYIDFFAQMDITISHIRNHLAAMMMVIRELPEFKNETCVILKMMGDSLGSILLDDGQYKNYMQRRLFHSHGTEDFAMEIGKHVNNILQFQSGTGQNTVSNVYFCGFTEEDRDCCQETMDIFGFPIKILPEDKIARFPSRNHCFMDEYREPCLGTYAGSIGNLLIPDGHEINFCRQLADEKVRKEKKARKAKIRKQLPIIVFAAVLLLIVAGLLGYRMYLSHKLTVTNEYINSEQNRLEEIEADKVQEARQKLETERTQIATAKKNLETYPDADSKLFTTVSNLAKNYSVTAEVSQYDSSTGILVIAAQSTTEKKIHQYIRALEKETELFSKVDYSGYTLNQSEGNYTINVNCVLKGNEVE